VTAAPAPSAPGPFGDGRPDIALLVGELERAQLADLIHDDVLQLLGASLLAAETCEQAWQRGRHEMLGEHLAFLREMLEQSVGRLRDLMADLRPYQSGEGGLKAALRRPFDLFQERNRGSVSFRQVLAAPLGSIGELLAYRLTLEALWSLAERNRPTEVAIELRSDGEVLELSAHFRLIQSVPDSEQLAPARIALLRWRAQALGGSLRQETPGPGRALLVARVPLPA
jgi:signal transduction histidine kinase